MKRVDIVVEVMLGLITIALILDLFDLFKGHNISRICYILLILTAIYFFLNANMRKKN